MLSKLGIGSLRFDFRGSGDSEGDFSKMTLESEVSDALLAMEYLRGRPEVAKDRIGIFGRSVGGTIAVMTASRTPVSSVVAWFPLLREINGKTNVACSSAPRH